MFYSLDGFGSLLIIILFVVLFTKISNLKLRVLKLESKNDPYPKPDLVPNVTIPATPIIESEKENAFLRWLKEDWLLKLGGFLLLIAFGWFVTVFGVMIGPMGRVFLGILAGVLILALGNWRIKKYINQGGVFLVLGSTIILLTVFAAQQVYSRFRLFGALLIMFLSTAFVALVSVKYDSFAVAFSSLILSALAPVLGGGSDNHFVIFSYLLIVVLGVIWLVGVKKNWGALVLGSLIIVFFYSLPMFDSKNVSLLNFAYIFALIFFLSSAVSVLKSKEEDIRAFLWTAILNGAFILSWIFTTAPKDWQSLIICIWMIIFALGSFALFLKTRIHNVFYVYAGVAVAMLATATAIELDGSALTFAYIIESALVPILIYLTTRDQRASSVSTLLLIGPIILSFSNLADYFNSAVVLSSDFFVLILLTLILFGLGLLYRKLNKPNQTDNLNVYQTLLILGSVYAYVLIWISLHVGMRTDYTVATIISLVLFTIIALAKYFYGLSVGSKTLKNYGGIFLGFVVLRLLFIDVVGMDVNSRVIVFFFIGLLLVSTAFIGKKIKNHEI